MQLQCHEFEKNGRKIAVLYTPNKPIPNWLLEAVHSSLDNNPIKIGVEIQPRK